MIVCVCVCGDSVCIFVCMCDPFCQSAHAFFFFFFFLVHPYTNTNTVMYTLSLQIQGGPGDGAPCLANKSCPRPELQRRRRRRALVTGLPDGPRCWTSGAGKLARFQPCSAPSLCQLSSQPKTWPGPEGAVVDHCLAKKTYHSSSQALLCPYFDNPTCYSLKMIFSDPAFKGLVRCHLSVPCCLHPSVVIDVRQRFSPGGLISTIRMPCMPHRTG